MSITSSDISPIDALLAFNKKFTFPGVVLFAKKSEADFDDFIEEVLEALMVLLAAEVCF